MNYAGGGRVNQIGVETLDSARRQNDEMHSQSPHLNLSNMRSGGVGGGLQGGSTVPTEHMGFLTGLENPTPPTGDNQNMVFYRNDDPEMLI